EGSALPLSQTPISFVRRSARMYITHFPPSAQALFSTFFDDAWQMRLLFPMTWKNERDNLYQKKVRQCT
ncbi:hypothetical protein, partial [Slackia isoflavoniconvertens]|uniref:hypothetical protein n=1 Tax=Slackia isoflavoniconvertens TaxID=572010 RepID=UPI003AEF1C26